MPVSEAVLELLRGAGAEYVSGEEMARGLQVSRTAVWKAVRGLQEAGYEIEGSPRRGYLLAAVPDLLYPAEVAADLRTEIIACEASLIHHYMETDSTNNRLKQLAEEGAPEGTVAIAEAQTAGRGRLGRSWAAPRGKGIWLSVLLKPLKPLEELSVFTLLTAVAVTGALKKKLPGTRAGIKWPNDVLIGGRKVCGILTELKAEADRLDYLIVGLGLNFSCGPEDFPPELAETAVSLLMAAPASVEGAGADAVTDAGVSRVEMTKEILRELESVYRVYLTGGAEEILSRWRGDNVTLGRSVTVRNLKETISGIAVDLDRHGALIVETDEGVRRKVIAGEIVL